MYGMKFLLCYVLKIVYYLLVIIHYNSLLWNFLVQSICKRGVSSNHAFVDLFVNVRTNVASRPVTVSLVLIRSMSYGEASYSAISWAVPLRLLDRNRALGSLAPRGRPRAVGVDLIGSNRGSSCGTSAAVTAEDVLDGSVTSGILVAIALDRISAMTRSDSEA